MVIRVGAPTAIGQVPYSLDNISYTPTEISQAASYIVEKISSTYYARPAPNSGLAADSGTSVRTIIQGTLDALTSAGGGDLYLKLKGGVANPHTINGQLSAIGDTPITIRGVGPEQTVLNYTGSGGESILNFNSGGYLTNQRITFEDVGINCPSKVPANTKGIDLTNVNKATLKRVHLTSPNGSFSPSYGVFVNGTGNQSLLMEEVWSSDFDTNFNVWQDRTLLRRCDADYGTIGFLFPTGGIAIKAEGCVAYHQAATTGIGFQCDYDPYFGQLTWDTCYSENPEGYAPLDYKLNTNAATANVVLQNCDAIVQPPRVLIYGNNYHAIGKYWNVKGSATITAGQTTTGNIAHGLCLTPRIVKLTPTLDTGGKRYWVSTKNATNIVVSIDSTYASNITFDYEAEV